MINSSQNVIIDGFVLKVSLHLTEHLPLCITESEHP